MARRAAGVGRWLAMVSASPGGELTRRLLRILRRGLTPRTAAGAAGIVAGGFIASRLLGLLRSVAIADAFGTEPELGAYWVAFRVPDAIFQLLAGATLSAAFIPTFSRVVLRESEEEGWWLASSVLNLIALATFVAAAIGFLLAPLIVPLLAPGLGEASGRETELQALAVELTRLMLISPLLFGISGMLTGILNARQHFLAPAIAPSLYNLGIIFGALVLAERWGVHGLAWGVVIGASGHLLVQLPALRTVGMRWRPAVDVASAGVREVLRLMGPRVIGLAAAQVNLVVVIFFASFISDEAISAVNFAFLVMLLPVGVIGMAISTAAFPQLSQQAAREDIASLRSSLDATLRMILFLAIPASAGLVLLAQPGVRLLLQRGAFDAASTNLVVEALTIYAVAVWAHAAIEILSRGFYALSDTRTPVTFALVGMLINVALCAALVEPLGIRGLAAAASVAAIVELLLLLRALRGRLEGFDAAALMASVWRTALATLVMVLTLILLLILLRAAGADPEELLGSLVLTAACGLAGLLAFLASAAVLGSREYQAGTRWLAGMRGGGE
ncbi:MAG: murein biosynthesis integral membrane protein MurJ [Chloroflexi bacterium]|nr:murein biosynthesis integral membrane protein MurJ [Chloroflexota bacterium]